MYIDIINRFSDPSKIQFQMLYFVILFERDTLKLKNQNCWEYENAVVAQVINKLSTHNENQIENIYI